MSNLGELTEKEKQEQKVFAAFAKCSGLNISAASIRSCKPQKPDICCDLDGSDYFFELGEVVSEVQAETLSTKGMYSSGFPDPKQLGPRAMVRMLEKKCSTKYETGGIPVDLLLYFSKDFAMYLSDVTSEGAEPTAIDLAAQECKRVGPFSRIWTYCSWTNNVRLLAES